MDIQTTTATYKVDDEGYLLDRGQWDEAFAEETARRRGRTLTDAHWKVIRFVREYSQEFDYVPDYGTLAKELRRDTGDDGWTRAHLNKLFPDDNPCRYAGLPKPPPGSCV